METLESLGNLGAELAFGDLKDSSSLEAACSGVHSVLSTASATLGGQPGDTIESVDREGQLALVNAAREAGVARFVFVSRSPNDVDSPSAATKDAVERELQTSGLVATTLRPAPLMEVWFSPAVGFDIDSGRVQLYGSGEQRVSWISALDVAEFAARSLDSVAAEGGTFDLGGPQALSPLEVVGEFERVLKRPLEVELVSEAELEAMRENASDSLMESYAAFSLSCARGCEIDMEGALEAVPVRLTTVSDYVARSVGS